METEDLIPAEVFCEHYNIEVSFISSLHEFGLIEITTVKETRYISKEQISNLEKMVRLHYELDINLEGIEAISHLLKRVEEMSEELNTLRNRLRIYEE